MVSSPRGGVTAYVRDALAHVYLLPEGEDGLALARILPPGGMLVSKAGHLFSRQGVVFSRDQLLNAVWGQDRAITDRAVDVYILRLRQKLEDDPANPKLIHSVRGFGYTFELREATAAAG